MKKIRKLCSLIALFTFFLSLMPQFSNEVYAAELAVTNVSTTASTAAQQLTDELAGSGVTISNATFKGETTAAGIFTGGATAIGFDSGIILSTGNASKVVGTNNGENNIVDNQNGTAGDTSANGVPNLEQIAGTGNTHDACILEFDVTPANNKLSFQYAFASEEYNQYANSDFNDIFALYVNGANKALIPGTSIPVSINNINGGNPLGTNPQNTQYYIDNTARNQLPFTMNGITTVFSVSTDVTAGVPVHIKLAIADVGDNAYDSNVFIKANSISDKAAAPGTLDMLTRHGYNVDINRGDGTDGTVQVTWTAKNTEGITVGTGTSTFADGQSNNTITVPNNTNTIQLTNPTNEASVAAGDDNPGKDISAITDLDSSTVPGAPAEVNAAAGNASVSLTWTAPANDGGSAITGYKIDVYSNGSLVKTMDTGSTATAATVTGLTNGTKYTFDVKAVNSIGDSASSAASSEVTPIAPATVPDAPTGVTAAAGNKSVALTWTAPANDGGSAITGYKIDVYSDGNLIKTVDTNSTDTSATITGLTNGTKYTFDVKAVNNVGDSVPSAATGEITPATVPDAPTGVTAAAGNKSVSLTWAAPANDGGSVITGYKIDVYSNGSLVKTVDTGSTSTAATITGLANGTKYTFDVKTVNANGDSVPSTATGEITPATVPDAPTGITAASGDKITSLTWTAPANDGGSAITGYKIDVYSNGSLVKTVDTNSTDTSATVTGLTNGTKYTFDVKAVNNVGDSVPSIATGEITPATVPDAPTEVTAASGNKSVSLTWTAPANDGGSAITGYKIDVYSDGNLIKTVDTNSTDTSATVTGLTNGTKYTFDVKAVNANGDSVPSSVTGEITPATVPDAPTGVTAASGNKSVSLTWAAPANDGGSAITGYKIDVYSNGSLVKTVDADTASTSTTVTGLANGTKYTFDVKAVNNVGDSVPSAATGEITPATVPDAPTGVTAAAGNKSVSLTWTAPANDGGSVITGYKVDVYSNGSLVKTVDTGSTSTAATITGLTNGTKYTFNVKTVNANGDSVPSTATGEITPATVPDAPTEVNTAAGNKSVSLTWTAPANDGGSTITEYKIDVYSNGSLIKTVDTGSTATAATVTGLTNGTKYTFDVKAVNNVGDSVPSIATGEITPATVPDAPTGVTAASGDKITSLTWTAPANDGGSAITGYKIDVYSNGSLVKTVDADPASTSTTITGLTNGTKYTFDVKAVNNVGDSVPSIATGEITPATVPDAPTEVTAAAGNKSVSLTWTLPANDGGSAITGYKIDVYSNGSLVKTVDTNSTDTSATVTGLTNGTKYTFDVKAVNSVGDSVPSAATGEIMPTTVPDAPTGVNAASGNKSVSLTWTAPVSDGSSAITGYKIDVYSNGSLVKTVDADPTSTSTTITGLTNGTKYTFDVKAVNANGDSAPSAATGEIIPVAPPTSTEPTIIAKVVDEANNSNPVASVNATVKSNVDGTETVNVKPSDAIVMKQPEGNSIPFEDYTKIGFGAPSTAPVTISSDGTVQISNLSKDASYSIPVTYDLGGGQKITIGNIHISVDSTGNVNMTSNLIDPYGTLTDSLSGNVISGANVTLYYADTARNKLAGKTPNTIVQLPTINGFKPNNNQNPQTTDSNGAYGYMVYPNTDYYIVVTKDGYDTFTSPSIAVGNDLVKFSAKLNPPVTGIKRVAGNTRVDTAIKLAKSEFTGKVNNIIFATADNFPDALAGSVIAYQQNAPILLVGDSKEDHDKVLTYMKEYLAANGKVFLLGGTGVLTENFANQVKTAGCSNIIRLGGADRYETAAKIADYLNVGEGTPVVIASGENYPDALSVSSAAAVNQYPILLVAKNVLSDLVKSELAKIKPSKVYIIGGQGAISDKVEKQVAQSTSLDSSSIVRLGGVDRYATAIAIANNFKLSGKSACIATGTNFPDALAGSIYAANYNAPIILVGNTLTDEEKAYIKNSKLSGVTIFGGEGAVNDEIENDVTTILSK